MIEDIKKEDLERPVLTWKDTMIKWSKVLPNRMNDSIPFVEIPRLRACVCIEKRPEEYMPRCEQGLFLCLEITGDFFLLLRVYSCFDSEML